MFVTNIVHFFHFLVRPKCYVSRGGQTVLLSIHASIFECKLIAKSEENISQVILEKNFSMGPFIMKCTTATRKMFDFNVK